MEATENSSLSTPSTKMTLRQFLGFEKIDAEGEKEQEAVGHEQFVVEFAAELAKATAIDINSSGNGNDH
jgi:hypothetical protein